MRVATWNVNGLRARMEFVALWLEEQKPDIVGFQELKMTDDIFPAAEFEALGYHSLSHGQKSWNGVAVLSRQPITEIQSGLPGGEEMGARFLRAETGGIDFTTVYCPNGKTVEHADYERKLAWFDALAAYWGSDVPTNGVLCGDFNIVPTALDSWRGESGDGRIFHTAKERARMASIIEAGWQDLWRQQHDNEQAFSWWDYRGGSFHRKHGLRIDFVLGGSDIAARCSDSAIDREFRKKRGELTASDHAPVFLDLSD